MSKPTQEVFKNHLGQEIKPGDFVIAVADGYSHSIHVRPGIYIGTINGKPSVVVQMKSYKWVDNDGKHCTYHVKGAQYKEYTYTRRSHYPAGRIYPTK